MVSERDSAEDGSTPRGVGWGATLFWRLCGQILVISCTGGARPLYGPVYEGPSRKSPESRQNRYEFSRRPGDRAVAHRRVGRGVVGGPGQAPEPERARRSCQESGPGDRGHSALKDMSLALHRRVRRTCTRPGVAHWEADALEGSPSSAMPGVARIVRCRRAGQVLDGLEARRIFGPARRVQPHLCPG